MDKCTLCCRSEASYICVCEETTVCGECLIAHQRSSPYKSHRPVPISHPLLGLMQDANYSVKTSSPVSKQASISEQIKQLELVRDQHYSQITEKILKLKLQLNLPPPSQTPIHTHRRTQSFSAQKSRRFLSVNSFKVVVVGGPGVGKETLKSSFLNLPVTSRQDFSNRVSKCFENCSGQKVCLNVAVVPCDTGNLRNSYFFRAKAVVFVFDLLEKESLSGLDRAVKEVWNEVKRKVPVFVVGSKADLVRSGRSRGVRREEVERVVEGYGGMYFEVSLVDEGEVCEFFKAVVEKLSDGWED